jgi:IS5 family transposase
MAELIPWSEFEAEYAENFPTEKGAPAFIISDGIGSINYQKKLGISVRPRVEQIRENPYLQYFIGQLSYSNDLPFDPSLLVHFRQIISGNLINKVNKGMVKKIREPAAGKPEKKGFGRKK